MTTAPRKTALAFAAALVGTTALAPLASARDWHAPPAAHQWRGEAHGGGHDDTAAILGFGLIALAGAAIIANATPAPAPAPVYAPLYPYAAPPAYAPAPACTTINGYAACLGPDGTWQYVR